MDLNAPLGVRPPRKPPRRLGPLVAVVATVAAVGGVATAGYFLLSADPHAGEPYGIAAIPPAAPKPPPAALPAAALDPATTASLAPRAPLMTQAASGAAAPATSAAAPTNGPLIIDVAKALADRQHLAALGPPPVPVPAAIPAVAGPAPRIAIFVGGMGLSKAATRTATEIMPAAVTFAFVPYGETVAAAVAAAKARGHEILLQVPMQSGPGIPLPGPHALRPGETPQETAEDTSWLLNRFQGYDGVTNLLGAPVTADRPVMAALLKAVATHGLFYVDDGTSRRSLAPALAPEAGLASARADVVLDATADPAVVQANLEALLAVAKQKGSAIGMASGLPDHLAAIAAFATELSARHVELVPVGALVARDSSVAVAR